VERWEDLRLPGDARPQQVVGLGWQGWVASALGHAGLVVIGSAIALIRTPAVPWPSTAIAVTLAVEPAPAADPQPPPTSSPARELQQQGVDAPPSEAPLPTTLPETEARPEDAQPLVPEPPRSSKQDTPLASQFLPEQSNRPPVRSPPPPRVAARTRKPSASSTGPAVPAPAAGQLQPAPQSVVVPTQLAFAPLVPPRPVSGLATNRKPNYPIEARSRRQEGRVLLRVQVSAVGAATAVEVVSSSGHPMLDQAARAAVQTWHFVPATRAGAAVPAQVEVPIEFRMQDG
jgi:periplasmic protein TonB